MDHQQQSCTLDECFQLYTKEEQLAPDDAWRCPHCKVLQQGTVKLSLWTLPDILIIHLKRFRQVGGRRNKLSSLVRFPLTGMDMAPHVVKRSQGGKNPIGQWSSWKQPPYRAENGPLDVLYDLYAVCNHHGSLQGGHYTAYCRNSMDSRWYSYDDSNVEQIPEDEVCTRGAYLLFYQKRNAIPAWSASSSVQGSTSSSISDHWVLRLNGNKRESVASRSTTNCAPLPIIPDNLDLLDEDSSVDQGCGTRAFVRGVKGRSASLRVPAKLKRSISKAMPLRWSFGPKDRSKPKTGELVEYLESGRRPKFTSDSVVPSTPSSANTDKLTSGPQTSRDHLNTRSANEPNSDSGQLRPVSSSTKSETAEGKPKEKMNRQDSSGVKGKEGGPSQTKLRTSGGDGPSALDSREKLKSTTSSGRKGDGDHRILTKDGDGRLRTPDLGQEEGKSKSKNSILKKESRRPSGSESIKPEISSGTSRRPSGSESIKPEISSGTSRRPSGSESIKPEISNGTSRMSISNGVLADRRTSGTMPRHKEDLTLSKVQTDIRRAHSSTSVQNKIWQ